MLTRSLFLLMTLLLCGTPAFSETAPITKKKSAQGFAFLIPQDQATLSSEFTGKIQKINLKDAETFAKDQVLIEFKCDIRESDLAQAKAHLLNKQTAFESAQKLEELASNSRIEVADAKAAYEMAMAEQKEKEALVEQCKIIAPFEGRVEEVMVHEAEIISPGTPMMKIIAHKNLALKLFVPSEWLTWLKVGLPFEVQFHELPERRYSAHLTKLGASVDAASQTIKVYGELNQLSEELLSGMSGEAYFNSKKTPAKTPEENP